MKPPAAVARQFQRYERSDAAGHAARRHHGAVQAQVLEVLGVGTGALNVGDALCGAGAQCRLWAEGGHHVFGADRNPALVDLARARARESAQEIVFDVACASHLPWPERSMDLVLAPGLLEQVADWRACLAELVRVLKPGGVLYLSTSGHACPLEQEAGQPLSSWYPGFFRRASQRREHARFGRLAAATAPNQFAWYALRAHMAHHGLASLEHVDLAGLGAQGRARRAAFALLRAVPPLRFCAHLAAPATSVLAFKAA